MIYVWLDNTKVMNRYCSYENYWNSLDYKYLIEGWNIFKNVMVEENTPLWNK